LGQRPLDDLIDADKHGRAPPGLAAGWPLAAALSRLRRLAGLGNWPGCRAGGRFFLLGLSRFGVRFRFGRSRLGQGKASGADNCRRRQNRRHTRQTDASMLFRLIHGVCFPLLLPWRLVADSRHDMSQGQDQSPQRRGSAANCAWVDPRQDDCLPLFGNNSGHRDHCYIRASCLPGPSARPSPS